MRLCQNKNVETGKVNTPLQFILYIFYIKVALSSNSLRRRHAKSTTHQSHRDGSVPLHRNQRGATLRLQEDHCGC